MKKFNIPILMTILFFCACEEVVDIDLDQSDPRLVIDASLKVYKGAEPPVQTISLSKSTGFYNEEMAAVENAEVIIEDEAGNKFEFVHKMQGIYINEDIIPETHRRYKLSVRYNEEIFTATETMIPVTEIESISQSQTGGFSGDEYEIKVFYHDPVGEENFYLFTFRNQKMTLEIYEDEFTDGNQIFGYYSNEDLQQNDTLGIEMAGISRAYYEYLFILSSQTGQSSGGPFETQPATVKGNIVNRTNKANFPFGYFQLSEVDSTSYVVQ